MQFSNKLFKRLARIVGVLAFLLTLVTSAYASAFCDGSAPATVLAGEVSGGEQCSEPGSYEAHNQGEVTSHGSFAGAVNAIGEGDGSIWFVPDSWSGGDDDEETPIEGFCGGTEPAQVYADSVSNSGCSNPGSYEANVLGQTQSFGSMGDAVAFIRENNPEGTGVLGTIWFVPSSGGVGGASGGSRRSGNVWNSGDSRINRDPAAPIIISPAAGGYTVSCWNPALDQEEVEWTVLFTVTLDMVNAKKAELQEAQIVDGNHVLVENTCPYTGLVVTAYYLAGSNELSIFTHYHNDTAKIYQAIFPIADGAFGAPYYIK